MKIRFVAIVAMIFAFAISAQAQGGGPRRTVEERVKAIHEKLDSAFKLEAATQAKVDSVFANYYREQDKVRAAAMSGGERPDFSVMREKMQPAADARDKELKTLLGDDKFKTWKEQIEPALMQRRGGGGGYRQ